MLNLKHGSEIKLRAMKRIGELVRDLERHLRWIDFIGPIRPVSRGYVSVTLVGWAPFEMMARPMTDERAKAVAWSFVEETLRESSRDDATIDRVYLIPDRNLYIVVVLVEGNKFRIGFPFKELTVNPDKSRQQARLFVKDGLPKRMR